MSAVSIPAPTNHPGQHADHRVAASSARPLQPLGAHRLELRDLVLHEPQARHVAAQLGERVRRQRRALRRAQRLQPLRRRPQGRLEAADARGGTRKTMIAALARKLLIALWRLATSGESPDGLVLRPPT